MNSTVTSRPGATLAVTAGGTLLAMTAFTAPLSIVPSLTRHLGATPVAASWVLSSMSLGLAVALLVSGAVGDEIGRRRVFVAGAALLAVGSAACAAAPEAWTFVAGRVLQGVGAAAVISCGLGIIGYTFPATADRARATGVWGACMGAGPALGPLLGSVLDAAASWRWAYVALTVLAGALAVAAGALLVESRSGRGRRVDATGALLLAAGTGCLLAALTGSRQGWSGAVPVLLAGAVVGLVAFFAHQARVREPMLELGLFRRPALVSATFAAFVTGAGIIALMSFVSTVLESGLEHSAVVAAVIVLAWSVVSAGTSLLARRIPLRFSGAARLATGMLVTAAGLVPLAVLTTATPVGQLVAGLMVAGVGTGLMNATLAREAVASVPPASAGAGSGINNASRYIGAAFGVTVVTALAGSPAGLVAGWNLAVLTGIALCVVGAAVVLTVQRAEARWTPPVGVPGAVAP
ncbi:MFS transporter [Pseudonocardia sp.]|uniref:MFS transporter n=1 Tax=Pseudonocardia sp. TaxID=60912 RepID=UPI0026278125|nr:MFS transporter [Pseudonocardia sp.]